MNSSNPDGANSKCYSIEIMSKLERTIFNLTQDNLENAIDIVIELFDINFPYTYNLFISNLIYFAFYSKIEVSDLYLSYLERIQKKEEEIDSKNLNIIKIFCEYISRINSQESNYLIEQMIERNLINASFTKNISTPYFYHYKTENEIFAKSAHIMSQNLNFFKNYKVLSKNDFELHKKYIKEGHNPNEIAKIIRNDEIEKLQEVSSQENFDFNQIFEPSIYERCSFVNDWGVSLIDYAAFFGSVQCFKYLLMNGAKGSNTGKYAVAGGNEEIIHLCEQNHSSFEGAYEAAIKFHRNDIFKYIYENNLETMYQYPPRFGDQYPLKFEDQYPQTPESSESLSSFSYLFRKMKQKDINDLGDICINNGNSEIFLYLLGKGLKIKESTINEAAKIGNLYLVKHFLLNNSIPNNILKFALKSGNIELVKYVLEQGVDLNTRNKKGNTFLMCASKNGYEDIVKLLLDLKIFNINDQNKYGKTALILASEYGHTEIVKLLLEQKGIDINAKDYRGWTALICASENGHTEIVKLLLEQEGIDINAKDDYGNTALMIASLKGDIKIVKLLLEHKEIDINAKDNKGQTVLSRVEQILHSKCFKKIFNMLHEKGAKL